MKEYIVERFRPVRNSTSGRRTRRSDAGVIIRILGKGDLPANRHLSKNVAACSVDSSITFRASYFVEVTKTMRSFIDDDGVRWEVSEGYRYGIGARPAGAPPVEPNVGGVLFTSDDGREVRTETAAGEIERLGDKELKQLLADTIKAQEEEETA